MKSCRALFGALILSLWLVVSTFGCQEVIPTTKNYAAWAQEFLRAIYPKLSDKKYVVSEEGLFGYDESGAGARWLTLYIGEGPKGEYSQIIGGFAGLTPPPKDFHFAKQYYKQFLTARFTFDDHDRLWSYSAEGIAIGNAESRAQYNDYIVSHPGLTQAETDAAIHQAGVNFGPNDQKSLAKTLPMNQLERFLGKVERISIAPVRSQVSDTGVVQWVDWSAELQIRQSDGTERRCQLYFDPFNGDLTALIPVPANPANK